jgi:DNA-binding NtrC family response regulator
MGDREPVVREKPRRTILIVDDDVRVLDLTGEMLRLAGYNVLKASIPSEAILVFEHNRAEIGLVLSDLHMPGLNGPELAGILRQRCPELPVVYMSAGADSCAPPDVLQKPFKMTELWLKVSDCLNLTAATATGYAHEMNSQA